jgi:hypothetical protein
MLKMIASGKRSIDFYRRKPEEEEMHITMNLTPLTPEQALAVRMQREEQDALRESQGLPPEVYYDITLNLS